MRLRREQLGISREALARDAGISSSTLLRLELAEQECSFSKLARIGKLLGLSLDELASDVA